jgi:protoporphyrinogen/coproporphyrinogen III oxidase
MSPVSVVHLAVANEDADAIPDGFGLLVPRGEGVRMLGCIFVSKLFGDRAPEGHELLACFLGGAYDPEAMALDDEALVEVVRDDLELVLDRRVDPKFVRVKRHPRAIPQLEVGHLDRIGQLRTLGSELGGLTLAGNYLSGVGISDATQSGLDAAAVLLGGSDQSDNSDRKQ